MFLKITVSGQNSHSGSVPLWDNWVKGDVKHLTNYSPEYRLRVGEYRVLFEIEENVVIIYRIRHRKSSYK